MSLKPHLRASVAAAKTQLAEGRDKLKRRHAAGAPGVQLCHALTDLVDAVVRELYEAALAELDGAAAGALRESLTLVAHGGYGRRDLAPYSDIDLMLLYAPEAARPVAQFAERLTRDLYDSGLSLGHSVRTPNDACELALKDATIGTSLMESRHLAGSESLFARFTRRYQQRLRRRGHKQMQAALKARAEERVQFGDTIYLLEPNIKRSPGGLRDLHLLRWTGYARYGVGDPDGLHLRGYLTQEDVRAIRKSHEFLLRLRNEMHFHAGKAHDVLDRAEQLRVSEVLAYAGDEALLPVEKFMKDYFQATTNISQVTNHFVQGAQPGHRLRAWFAPLVGHQVQGGDYLAGPLEITATRRGKEKLAADLTEALRLADLANLYDKRIAYSACQVIRKAAPSYPEGVTSESARHFLSLLAQPARLGEMLRTLHDLRVLERVIPEYAHARCLLQFNEYHRYTVDEHCIRAVERCVELKNDPGALGEVYRSIKQKRVLHLALLIHDLGKGHVGDHSDVGLQFAIETARRLRLPPAETELLKFLVHKHLNMSHLAFRRDTSDEQLIVKFAVEVGSPEALKMLFALTAADFAAVGPGVWNRWKGEVLAELYRRTMQHLAGDGGAGAIDQALDERRRAVRAQLRTEDDLAWFNIEIDSLPSEYLRATPPQQVAAELKELRNLPGAGAIARGRYLAESHTVEYTISTRESIAPGIFHRLTGALSSQGLEILSAQINTLAEGLVLDRFGVADPDYAAAPPQSRIDAVCAQLVESLRAADGQRPSFRRTWSMRADAPRSVLPTQVRTDNNTSDRYTIIDVFAADRAGLLYRVTRALYELGLSVALAKIATHLDQVLDVFYVTDQHGHKITDDARLQAIESRLLEEINQHERQETSRASAY